ncbi:MAG: hypothetical protein AAB932_05245, partial [Patescibacteria group bacterium]
IQTLHSSLTELHAFLPINDVVYYNQHNSHPAALFSERFEYVKRLAALTDPKLFWDSTRETPFGPIDLFVFYTGDPNFYPVYFHQDDFPRGLKETVVSIPRQLFDSAYFEKTFENGRYVVFAPRKVKSL